VEPRVCLALEDSHNGVRSASSAGMMTIMVPDLLARADRRSSGALHLGPRRFRRRAPPRLGCCVRPATDLTHRELVDRDLLCLARSYSRAPDPRRAHGGQMAELGASLAQVARHRAI
jgi:hypothetical protein